MSRTVTVEQVLREAEVLDTPTNRQTVTAVLEALHRSGGRRAALDPPPPPFAHVDQLVLPLR